LTLATAKVVRLLVPHRPNVKPIQQLFNPVCERLRRQTRIAAHYFQVLGDGQERQKLGVLENEAQVNPPEVSQSSSSARLSVPMR
jgi:hypothetical protein